MSEVWCVCLRGEPPPLYIGVLRGHPGGIFPESTPHRQPPLNDRTASRSWPHLAERRVRPCPGRAHAWGGSAPLLLCLAGFWLGLGHGARVGLDCFYVGWPFPPLSPLRFPEKRISDMFHLFPALFLHSHQFYRYKWK